jgi:uncharacterized protein YkwD
VNLRLLFSLILFSAATVRADSVASQVLEEINFARTQPQQYARIVSARADRYATPQGSRAVREAIRFLQNAPTRAPLSWSRGIGQAALSHALEVGASGGRGHRNARGEMPWTRMARFGQWQGHAGENIDYGHADARSIVVSLIVDAGVPSRLHRTNLFNRAFRVTGIAVSAHASSGTICVMNFASGFLEAGEPRVATRGGGGLRSEYSGMSFF